MEFIALAARESRDIVSRLERMEIVVQRLIDNIVEAFEKLD